MLRSSVSYAKHITASNIAAAVAGASLIATDHLKMAGAANEVVLLLAATTLISAAVVIHSVGAVPDSREEISSRLSKAALIALGSAALATIML